MKHIYLTLAVLCLMGVGLLVAQTGTRTLTVTTNRLSSAQAQTLGRTLATLLSHDPNNANVTVSATPTAITITLTSSRPAALLGDDLRSFLGYKILLAKHAQDAPSPWSTKDLAPYQGVILRGVTAQ